MGNYNYAYDIVSVVLTAALLCVFTMQHGYATKTSKIYVILLHANLVLAITDILTCLVIYQGNAPLFVKYLIHIPCLVAYNLVSTCFFMYVLIATKADRVSRIDNLIAEGVMVAMTALIVTTPFTHLIEDLSIPQTVTFGPCYPVMYACGTVLLLYDTYLLIRYQRFLKKLQVTAICGGILLTLIASIVQLFTPDQLVISASAAIMLVLVYAALEDPSEYMYEDSECYNERAFYASVSTSLASHENDRIILFRVDGYEYISHMLDDKMIKGFRNELITFFQNEYTKKNVFCISNDMFAVIVEDEWGNEAEKAIADFPGLFKAEDIEFSASLRATELDPVSFRTSLDVRHVVETVAKQNNEGEAQRICELTRDALEKRDNEVKIVQCVRHALKNNGFEIYYQPILEEKSGKYVSAEALIRLRNTLSGKGEFISPAVFIPLAEQNGLIIQIGEYVFDSVCRFYTENHLDRLGVEYIEVNLSPIQCMQQDLTLRMQAIMRRYGISPEHINLEITETAESRDKYVMQRNIKSLLNRGMTFSLDDFGTGFSNIDHLARLPVSLVKFDKSLLDDAMADENSKIILSSLMQMLKGLKYKCVAEGIETPEMHEMVRNMGCDYYQGYLFSKPIPEQAYVQFLKQN